MSFNTFVLVSVLVLSTYAQVQTNRLGGIFNGLRYTFNIPAQGVGCSGRPNLPGNGNIVNSGQLCFFMHEMNYIYSTDCADAIVDRYAWTGMNSTLPGGFNGVSSSSRRFVSDGTFQGLSYSYNYANGNGNNGGNLGNVTNRFFAVTTNEDYSAITSFIYYSPNCITTYALLDASYKPYTAWGVKYATYRTTNNTGFGAGWCGNNNNGGVGYSGVCLGSCPNNANTNQGWVNMPTVVCVDVDRWNSYKLTDCVGNDLSHNYWWKYGGYPNNNNNNNNGNNGNNGIANYMPYGVKNERGSWQLGLTWGANAGGSGYFLTAAGPCGATWKVSLTRAVDAVSQPRLTPVTGLYRLHSNYPTATYNNFHFPGNGFNNGFAGGVSGWSTYCYNQRDALPDSLLPKNLQLCLIQQSSNQWRLTDCTTYRTKVIMTFGWNGVSFTGMEGGRPIVVSFNSDGRMTGWTGIFGNGMCQYTFTVRDYNPMDKPYITNGIYSATYTPAWDFVQGNRYYYYSNNFGGADWSDGNCTGLTPPESESCVYNNGNMVVTSDCAGSPQNFYSWSGLKWETNPFGVESPRRSYYWIDTASVTESSFLSHMVRGGCEWLVENTLESKIAGPHVSHGHYTKSSDSSMEGACLPAFYDDVGIYPSGLPSMEYAIQDWATGEIYVTMKWDGSTYSGYDKWGMLVTAIVDVDNRVFSGIFGYAPQCMWSISYDFEWDAPVLPRIKHVPAHDKWSFTDAYGVWNGKLTGGSCYAEDPDVKEKYNTLICIWPNGPAVLNLIQCNDNRADYQHILQQAVWKGGLGKWQGTDYGYSYEWGYLKDDEHNYDEITFIIEATGDSGCTFTLTLWRGDDCETAGWKAGISVLSVFAAFLVLVVLYLLSAGGGGGGGGGYHEYQ